MSHTVNENDINFEGSGMVFGRNPVLELFKSGKNIDKLYIQSGLREGSAAKIVAQARNLAIPVVEVSKKKLDEMAGEAAHQGVAAMASIIEYATVEDILENAKSKGQKPFIVICDSINDPHNLGAIIRTADAAGVHGVIIPKRGSVGITPTVLKSSVGAALHMPVAKVTNIASTVDFLKKQNIWIYALEANGTPYYNERFDAAAAFILGSEGEGVSRLLKEKSDFILSIPMYGKVTSLNVSAAAAVVLMEVAKQINEMG